MKRTMFFRSVKDWENSKACSNDDNIVIYDNLKKRRKFTSKSVNGSNFSDVAKIDYAIGITELLDQVENLKRELSDQTIMKKFYMRKLAEKGISTEFSPEEIKEFKSDISAALTIQIDKIMDNDLIDTREFVNAKVSKILAEAKDEYEDDPQYEMIRLLHYNKIIDVEIDKTQKSQIATDKKQKTIVGYMKMSNDNTDRIKEYRKIYGDKELKKEDKSSNGSFTIPNLSSFGKDE